MYYRLCGFAVVALATSRALAAEFHFPVPSDDRWHYPFNFTPGTRGSGSLFGAVFDSFNDRDGIIILAWDTSEFIEPGLGPDAYEVDSLHFTITNQSNSFVNPNWPIDTSADEWYTFDANGDGLLNGDGIPRGEPGDLDGESDDLDAGRPIELFGAGFDVDAPFDEMTWTQSSIFIGGAGAGNVPRNPFPFVFDENENRLHAEDCIKGLHNEAFGVFQFTPEPWAVGAPVGYVPGAQSTPFDITFDVDLSQVSGAVRRYFQEQLDRGRIIVIVTSLRETDVQGPTSGFPSIYMKEGLIDAGAKAASMTVSLLQCAATGDVNDDLIVDVFDAAAFVDVALGVVNDPEAIERADLNCDGRVDGLDVQPLVDSIF